MGGIINVLATLVFLAGVVIATLALPKIWRGRPQDAPFDLPGLSDAAMRACLRAVPLALVAGWLMLAATPWAFRWLPMNAGARGTVLTGFEATIGAVVVLMLSVGLWNRPKIAVPPLMRGDAGYLKNVPARNAPD